jgi:FkbM family methyltransferase
LKKYIFKFLRKFNFPGKWRLINLLRDISIPVSVVVPYKNNTLISINPAELIGYEIYWNGGYENTVMWILDSILKKDDIAVDFGANIGVWSIVLAKKCSFVYCVEPHPSFRKNLLANLELNQFVNFEIIPFAVSQTESPTTLYAPPDTMMNKSASTVNLNSELTVHISVESKRMDTIFSELSRLDFIKIDCDGSDGDIILSGKDIISKHLPIILFEDLGGYNSAMGDVSIIQKVDTDYNEAFIFLKNLRYRFFEVHDQHMIDSERVIGRFSIILAVPIKTSF